MFSKNKHLFDTPKKVTEN